jgi:catechol 2,3-dioxygenase-like lactoylglutathione lyase family enzyme
MSRPTLAVAVALLVAVFALRPFAQQAGGPSGAIGNVIRISKYIISVADADRSAAFYRSVFGLTLANGATEVAKAQPIPDLVQKLTGVGAPATFRALHFTLPAAPGGLDDFEHTEFNGPSRPSSQPRMQDPGASFLVFNVRDLDLAIANVKRMGGTVVTAGGEPVGNNGNRAVFVRDPDGAFVEMIQPPQVPPATDPKSLVIGAPRVAFVVADAEKAGRFYRDAFGFDVRMPGEWNDDQRIAGLPGLPGSKVRSATVTIPGRTLSWQFYEYGNLPRTPHVRNIPDPGAAAVAFEVRDTAAALEVFKAAGGTVISQGGRPVEGRNLAFVRDPNGVLIEVVQAAPAR